MSGGIHSKKIVGVSGLLETAGSSTTRMYLRVGGIRPISLPLVASPAGTAWHSLPQLRALFIFLPSLPGLVTPESLLRRQEHLPLQVHKVGSGQVASPVPQSLRAHSTSMSHPIPTFRAHSNTNNLVRSPRGHTAARRTRVCLRLLCSLVLAERKSLGPRQSPPSLYSLGNKKTQA